MRRLSALSLVLLFALAVVPAYARRAPPAANTIVVTNLNDDGPGSLRQAIADASDGVSITFATGLTGTIALDRPSRLSGKIFDIGGLDRVIITHSISIVGPQPKTISIKGSLQVFPPGNVKISNLIFTDSMNPVENVGAILFIDDVVFQDNAETFRNADKATLYADGTTTITRAATTINNSSFIQNGMPILNDEGIVTIANSLLLDNESPIGNIGTLNITNTTFQGNKGGVSTTDGFVTITNSTFKDNTGLSQHTLTSTIPNGIRITNTIVDLTSPIDQVVNNGQNCEANIGTGSTDYKPIIGIVDGGNNLQFPDQSCGANIPALDPRLGTLSENGGPTQTIPLLPNSPAIGAGNPIVCATVANNLDQRGMVRAANGKCDIGAFEFNAVLPVSTTDGTP